MYVQDPTAGLARRQPPLVNFERVGSFRYPIADDQWEWSDEVARMQGYRPGTVVPTTELIPSQSPARTSQQIRNHRSGPSARRRRSAACSRILDTEATSASWWCSANASPRPTAGVIGTTGFYIDITDASDADVQRNFSDRVATIEI